MIEGRIKRSRTYAIIGANEVHKQLGCGFLSRHIRGDMIELSKRQIPFSREVRLPVFYRSAFNTPIASALFVSMKLRLN